MGLGIVRIERHGAFGRFPRRPVRRLPIGAETCSHVMRPGEIDPGAGVTRIGGDRLLENLDGLRGTPSGLGSTASSTPRRLRS